MSKPSPLTGRLEALSHHVVDETVRVRDAPSLELLLVLILIDFLENVFETSIVQLRKHDNTCAF